MAKRNRQTVSYLRNKFAEIGLHPHSRRGQNFLVDYNLIELLARSAHIQPTDVVLEVGTGTGSLTAILADLARVVVTVELDQHLHQLAREELEQVSNVRMLCMDALSNKNRIAPEIIRAVEESMEQAGTDSFRLVANLPYNIATPLISNLVRRPPVPRSLTVTIQKELADRLTARPSTKDYGALSVWIQSLCRVEVVRVVAPTVFWPRPKVESAIVHIEPVGAWRHQFSDLEFFHSFTRALFFHRRKYLRSVLISAFKGRLEKPDVDRVMQQESLDKQSRAEALTVEQIQQLSARFQSEVERLG